MTGSPPGGCVTSEFFKRSRKKSTVPLEVDIMLTNLLAMAGQASLDLYYCLVCAAGQGEGRMGLTSRTTISAHGAFSTRRVPVGTGQ